MFNKAILIGRLTSEPELKTTQSGTYVCSITLAVDRRFKDQSGERKADFINIVAWRQAAEFVSRYFGKGDPLGVEGSIQTRQYEDRQGNKRTAVEVVADNIFFVGGKQTREEKAENPPAPQSNGEFEEVGDTGDLPF